MLKFAGYRADNPQVQAAHDQAFIDYISFKPEAAAELVDTLYRAHCQELLQLEKQVQADASEGGVRMREFLQVLRHSILAWIVSTTARPRDRFGLIAADRPIKRLLCAPAFTKHLEPLLGTTAYAELAAAVRSYEEYELRLGPLANVGAEERRTRLALMETEQRLTARIDAPRSEEKAAECRQLGMKFHEIVRPLHAAEGEEWSLFDTMASCRRPGDVHHCVEMTSSAPQSLLNRTTGLWPLSTQEGGREGGRLRRLRHPLLKLRTTWR